MDGFSVLPGKVLEELLPTDVAERLVRLLADFDRKPGTVHIHAAKICRASCTSTRSIRAGSFQRFVDS